MCMISLTSIYEVIVLRPERLLNGRTIRCLRIIWHVFEVISIQDMIHSHIPGLGCKS